MSGNQMKGVTPVIAIIILLLITVALAGTAMSYLQGYLFTQVTKTFQVPAGGAYCESGVIRIYVSNTGYQSPLVSPGDFILASVDSKTAMGNLSSVTLNPGQGGLVLQYNCTAYCPNPPVVPVSGYHTVDLGTGSSIKHMQVFCP